ncbi:hypothetical protein JZ751_011747 [Albula glossodonta]|uniref:Trafficking protein particle complex subunit 13 n=1 Tax=Albula glossodonta TaxID=121402 RepID=A0A8T2PQK5_9TELE|nr:hypothetical protein JZ751_011747 [Albula glossodonta]
MDVNQAKQEQLLALKVMRLTKPTLFTNMPVTCEDRDLPGELFGRLMKEDPSTIKGAETLMLGEMLTLPQNFGGRHVCRLRKAESVCGRRRARHYSAECGRNIFLGETFSSYISVHNDSTQVVKDILVKADLQTSSQRLNLSASNSAVTELKPECCIDDVIHHEVKEIGTHMSNVGIRALLKEPPTSGGVKQRLSPVKPAGAVHEREGHTYSCIIMDLSGSTEEQPEKSAFSLQSLLNQVLKPLDVKTKFYNAEVSGPVLCLCGGVGGGWEWGAVTGCDSRGGLTDEVFLEAQIQNITTSPMFMEKVSLEPSMMYNVTELNTVASGDDG